MNDVLEFSEELIDDLKTERDLIKLQLHLAKADAKDEWERLDENWDKFMAKSKAKSGVAGSVLKETAEEAKLDLAVLASDLKDGYLKLRARLEK